MKRNGDRRKLSGGTVFMLILSAVVLAGSAAVLIRLSSGASVDLSRLSMNVLDLQDGTPREQSAEPVREQTKSEEKKIYPETAAQETKAPAAVSAPEQNKAEGSFTLTIGGSISLSDEVRKNCWNTDSKSCDYSDVMMLLAPEIRSDMNAVFTENLFSDSYKANDTVAPETAADLLKEGGFNAAACGFSQAFAKGTDGVEMTRLTMLERNILPLGIRDPEEQDQLDIRTVGNVRTAFLQYTGTISSKTRKSMEKAGASGTVPEAEAGLIAEEIAAARNQGAEAVIVLFSWGKTGKDPDKSQHELAAAAAEAGADLIVGSGSHIPQGAEYLAGKNGNKVLCVWSLGSLLSGDRANVKHMSGYLLHVTVRSDGQGGADILRPEYTPVYTWKYKQDGRYYYRCMATDQEAPDGMDSEQKKNLAKAEQAVTDALKGSPVTLRKHE